MAILAFDDFNRTNANPIGGNWTTVTTNSAMQIVSNACTPSSTAADCGAYWNAFDVDRNQYVQAKMTATGGVASGETGPLLMVRTSTSQQTYYRFCVNKAASNNASLGKFVNGTYTGLWIRTVTFNDGDTFRLEVIDNVLRAYRNGVQIGADQTDSSITAGRVGIGYSSTITAATLDDWEGGDFAVPPLPKYPDYIIIQALLGRQSILSTPPDVVAATNVNAATAGMSIVAANAQIAEAVNAVTAGMTFTAVNAQIAENVNAAVAAATIAAGIPQVNIAVNPTTAPINFTAFNPTVVTGTMVNAASASMTIAAADAQIKISPNAATASTIWSASNAQPKVSPTAVAAVMSLLAGDMTAKVAASAVAAAMSIAAANASAGISPHSNAANLSFTAFNPSILIAGNVNVNPNAAVMSWLAANAQGIGDVYVPPKFFDNLGSTSNVDGTGRASGGVEGQVSGAGVDGSIKISGMIDGRTTGGGSVDG